VVALLIAMQPPLAPGRQGLGKRAVEGAASDTGHASKDEDPVVLTHTQAKQRSADKILTSRGYGAYQVIPMDDKGCRLHDPDPDLDEKTRDVSLHYANRMQQ
jgi:hypothetical protein